jgi:hypothetical protein
MDPIEVEIELMIKAKYNLDGLHREDQSVEYKLILSMIDAYLNKHCNHCIISDMIDISDSRSQPIHYCEHCGLTFDPSV